MLECLLQVQSYVSIFFVVSLHQNYQVFFFFFGGGGRVVKYQLLILGICSKTILCPRFNADCSSVSKYILYKPWSERQFLFSICNLLNQRSIYIAVAFAKIFNHKCWNSKDFLVNIVSY